jgi:hypothetical protein
MITEVITAVNNKSVVFWDVELDILVHSYLFFLNMEALISSETLITMRQTILPIQDDRSVNCNIRSDSIKGGAFHDQFSDCQLPKEDSVACSLIRLEITLLYVYHVFKFHIKSSS